MKKALTEKHIDNESRAFRGTGATSVESCSYGFRPAFLDTQTGIVYTCRYADGRLAPMHLLDGLPPELVVARTPSGRVTAVKGSLIAGFIRHEQFYNREEAVKQIMELTQTQNKTLQMVCLPL